MLKESIRILNFDGSLLRQKKLLSRYQAEIIDLSSLGPRVRYWMDRGRERLLMERIHGSSRNCLTFLGSGDFHHLTASLLKEIEKPFCLISFDLHPDWDVLPPRLGCGSWVSASLGNERLLKCILVGVSSQDLSTCGLKSANLASLKNDRVEIYPYAHAPTKVFLRRVPVNVSVSAHRGILSTRICWEELKGKNLAEFFISILRRLPIKEVYISVDKDCLRKEFALTNWEEGLLSLDELLLMLKLIKDNLDILGMDVVGEYSPILIKSPFKSLVSRFDHPSYVAAQKYPEDKVAAINEETNLRIADFLFS